ncbi:conjugal transfer protein [Pseudomonas nicosulfuronedens]|uniref:Conjugal transfer protein n=1 Tax=Pseudomonas nicosulfuronedens TaxID=2571105 RepID=A0A5R9QLB4_9PSED|nr:conjugal transfer protein [Pseudomonas nicosulfuronedens]
MVRRFVVLAASAALSTAALAVDTLPSRPALSDLDPTLLEQAKTIVDNSRAIAADASPHDYEWVKRAGEEVRASTGERDGAADNSSHPPPHPLGDGEKTLIFVSWSMGARAIEDILVAYDGVPGVGVVFRGIPEDVPMATAVARMQRLTKVTRSTTPILLDPLAFLRHGVFAVPSIGREDGEQHQVAFATGSSSTSLLSQRVAQGKRGNLGSFGSTTEIIEPDLMAVAKSRIEQLDVGAMKQRAIARFWDKQPGFVLPTVEHSSIRPVDPSVIIPQDILGPDGRVVIKAGRMNPLDVMPFGIKLVVIDPTSSWQVDLARREVATKDGLQVIVIASHIPGSTSDVGPSGWELFNDVQDSIAAPLYLLQQDLAARYQVTAVPSVVTAEDKKFVVREISQSDAQGAIDAIR